MIYTITKLLVGVKVEPAVPAATCLEIESQFRSRLVDVVTRGFIPSTYVSAESFNHTIFQMADKIANDADVEMVRQILQKHEDEDAASQLRMARHREQMELDMGMGGDV